MAATKLVLLLSPTAAAAVSLQKRTTVRKCTGSSARLKRRCRPYLSMKVCNMAKESGGSSGSGVVEIGAVVGGLVSNPVIGWSLYTLKTTGCGLPPGPGGSIGALEGVSYLLVVGIISWSLYTKAKTGSGLPNGPYGLLGAVEGLSYLSLLAILLVFGLQLLERGYLPGPLPGDQCY